MKNMSEKQEKIIDIINDMDREEAWDTTQMILTILTVRDIKENKYSLFLDEFTDITLNRAKSFKRFMEKELNNVGHA